MLLRHPHIRPYVQVGSCWSPARSGRSHRTGCSAHSTRQACRATSLELAIDIEAALAALVDIDQGRRPTPHVLDVMV